MRLHVSNFGIQFLSRNIRVSIHNFFKTRMLLDMFDAELVPYKLSYFEPLCLRTEQNGGENREKVY